MYNLTKFQSCYYSSPCKRKITGKKKERHKKKKAKRTYNRASDFKWLILSVCIIDISLESKYNSDVSCGIPFGISFNLLPEHRTTVPVHVHDGGQ